MTPSAGLWCRTPPAIFVPIFGLFGLGLVWRSGALLFGLPSGVGDLILGATTLLYLFALTAWLAKPLRRPSVVLDELRVLPGRAGLAAMSLSMMLMAATLVPHAPRLATGVAVTAFALHALLAVLLIVVMLAGPPEGRVVTPVWHVSFLGFIVGPLAGIPLGFETAARIILWGMLPLALFIWATVLWQVATRIPPAPLRPLLAINLAPASVYAMGFAMLGETGLAAGFAVLGGAILLALLLAGRWITTAGFSPLWAAFTFPLAAYAGALDLLAQTWPILRVPAGLTLVAATLIIPPIAFAVLRAWARGGLAAKTSAAQV